MRNILSVDFNEENGQYQVSIPTGSNVAETAFAMSVIIRCFVRDKIVDNSSEVLNLVNKYLTDSQYEELEEENEQLQQNAIDAGEGI